MKELTISLQTESKVPLYEQIYSGIRQAILSGRISKGEKLPSTRFQAQYLQVSRSTVELAYEQLLSEGYIYSEPYRGYFACDVRELYQLTDLETRKELGSSSVPHAAELENFAEETVVAGRMQPGKIEAPASYRIDFSPNGIELAHFPYGTLSKIMKNLILDRGQQMLLSSASLGDPNLRGAICDYLYRARGVNCVPDQIVLGAGNEYLLLLLSQIWDGFNQEQGREHSGKKVAIESPTYMQAYRTFLNLNCQVAAVDVDREGMDVGALEASGAQLAYVMPSHQFPLGIVMSMKRRLELLQWAGRASGRYIIEDDYDSEFRYKGKPIPALQGMDKNGKVIYLGTFSKSIAPAVRISYMVLPSELLERYRQTCGFYSCTVPTLMQQSVYQFMKEGGFEKNLNRMRGIYRTKHDMMQAELRTYPWVIQIQGGNAGLHFLVKINTAKSEQQIVEACEKKGVRVYGLSEFDTKVRKDKGKPMLVLGYGGLCEAEVKEGLALLDEIVKQ